MFQKHYSTNQLNVSVQNTNITRVTHMYNHRETHDHADVVFWVCFEFMFVTTDYVGYIASYASIRTLA